jgi:hypothetical protein
MSICQQSSKNQVPPKAPLKRGVKYRSPDPSPVSGTHREQVKTTQNLNAVTKLSRKSSTSPINPSSRSSSKNKENQENLCEFIFKYHPALASKNTESSKQDFETLSTNFQTLQETLERKQSDLEFQINERRLDLKKQIEKVESEASLLTLHLDHLKSKDSQKELFKLLRENSDLEKKIVESKVEVVAMKEKGIKQEAFFLLQEKIVTLELTQNKLLDKNQELKQELRNQVTSNLTSKSLSEQKSNLSSMWGIFSLIKKLQKLSKKYIAQETIHLSDLMQSEEPSEDSSIPGLIFQTRKEISNLRVLVSDIYAENCGVSCQSQ